jgi:Fur family peroxide stress response transcriptional regulator
MEKATKHFRKRDAILTCLRETTEHPSAEWVYSQLKQEIPDLSLGTVYRNLSLFKEQGVICSLGTVKGVERFDANTEPHVHYICTECGKVLDLQKIQVPEDLNQAAATDSGGEVTGCQLTFTGVCGQCAKNI